MNIEYYTKNVYGRDKFYPVSPDAIVVSELMGTKTLTDHAMAILGDNGATFTEVWRPRVGGIPGLATQ
mgnify:CR=1 FL=1